MTFYSLWQWETFDQNSVKGRYKEIGQYESYSRACWAAREIWLSYFVVQQADLGMPSEPPDEILRPVFLRYIRGAIEDNIVTIDDLNAKFTGKEHGCFSGAAHGWSTALILPVPATQLAIIHYIDKCLSSE